jgi:hypothetical protein
MNSKKILAWLERNVQWFAIALGLAYVGWMTWSYVVSAPVTLTLSGTPEPLGPGTVDPYIDDKIAAPLHSMIMAHNKVFMPSVNFRDEVDKNFRGDDIPLPKYVFAENWISSHAADVKLPGESDTPGPEVGPVVTQFPTVPQAQIVDVQSGRANVIPASVAQPGQAPPSGQPKSQDCIWSAVKYSIPVKDLTASFTAAAIPQLQCKTTVLRVTLVRQELLSAADGTWGPEVEISPLTNVKLNQWPAENNTPAQSTYASWAQGQPGRDMILQPPFYQVIAGDVPWQVAPPPEPPKPRVEEKPKPQAPRPQRPPSNPGGGSRGGGRLVEDPERDSNGSGNYFTPPNTSLPYYQPFQNNGEHPGGGGPRSPTTPPNNPPPTTPEAPAAPVQIQAAPALPPGQFMPASLTADIVGWAYDDSVVPGHTYRYRVVYKIQNPIWQTVHIAKDPKLTQQFALSSADAGESKFVWTKKIDVPSLTKFFLADNVSGSDDRAVHIWVVKWQAGKEKRHLFDDVMPGDYVGRKGADGDFVTGCVLVDVQPEENNRGAYILTMDDRGNLIRNDWKVDQALAARRTTD